ncbi:MAG: 3-oxoacyl-ACP reductase FabG [Thermoleophilia bacterium]|nr:3-oxoacyl-ACP reductase FabG [Thermoleophilia bacterium]
MTHEESSSSGSQPTASGETVTASPGKRLSGRVAVVTGGGGRNSIGRAICLRLAQEGACVAVLDVNEEGAERVAHEIAEAGGAAMPVPCDVTDLDQCMAAAHVVARTWNGRIDILVNNAALFGGMGAWRPFDKWTPEEWDLMQRVNVRGMWFCAQAVFPYMRAQNYGKIVNIASNAFFQGVPGFIHYVASKGAVVGFTRALAKELGQYGIRVNAIAPGFTVTDAQLELTRDYPEWYEENRRMQALSERNELPEDLAGPVLFFCSADSDFVTGQTLVVDGGATLH